MIRVPLPRGLAILRTQPTPHSQAGDLRGIRLYQSLDSEGLHTLGTVIVDYRGYRVVGQSIISGILSYVTLSVCMGFVRDLVCLYVTGVSLYSTGFVLFVLGFPKELLY